MAVVKGKRKESQFEVIKHFYRMRKEITDLLLRDFGYSQKKSRKKIEKMSKKQRKNMNMLFKELMEVHYV